MYSDVKSFDCDGGKPQTMSFLILPVNVLQSCKDQIVIGGIFLCMRLLCYFYADMMI